MKNIKKTVLLVLFTLIHFTNFSQTTENKIDVFHKSYEKVYESIKKNDNKRTKGIRNFTTDSGYYVIETLKTEVDGKLKTINLNTKKLRVMKRDLKDLLNQQGISLSREFVIDIWLNDFGNLTISGRDLIPMELQNEYSKILSQYKIISAPNRKILLSKSFIIIGDFEADDFRGSAQGNIKKIDLEIKKAKWQ